MADDNSSEDSDVENQNEFAGVLSKWTNYIHGWQDRYIVLKNGTLSYYKSEQERGYGCRGALSLAKAIIKPHEFDECRFDVSVNDCVWYLRADSIDSKQSWVEALESYKKPLKIFHYEDMDTIYSTIGLQTVYSSRLVDSLIGYKLKCHYNRWTLRYNLSSLSLSDNLPVVDFKGEAITFKSTTAAVIDTLTHCAELVTQREESWHKRLDKEVDRRKKAEALSHSYFMQIQKIRTVHPGPDLEEGPHSVLADDEFYDAVESGLDKMEEEQELRERLKNGPVQECTPGSRRMDTQDLCLLFEDSYIVVLPSTADETYGRPKQRSLHTFAFVQIIFSFAFSFPSFFFLMFPSFILLLYFSHLTFHLSAPPHFQPFIITSGLYFSASLENMSVIENISEDTVTFMQVYKRIWPASQRDIVFWSHMRKLPNEKDRDGPDIWTVVNNSTEYPEYPANNGKCVRMSLKVCLMCQTRVNPPKDGAPLSRSDVSCKITYCSVVNPGGWAPPSVLRAVYKREYPKFLKRFTAYVINQTKNKPIMF
nr:collagen type IV alpha-3-binding protein-like [Leptinotarsa decemlineata]